MKHANKLLVILTAVSATLFLPSAIANNGIQFSDDTIEGSVYVDCLGAMLDFELQLRVAYHEFETPSGTYHLVGNWHYTSLWTNPLTGDTWVGRGNSPSQESTNIGPGETFQFTTNEMVKPLAGDGPKWKYQLSLKITVNANGDLVVYRENLHDDYLDARCLGEN